MSLVQRARPRTTPVPWWSSGIHLEFDQMYSDVGSRLLVEQRRAQPPILLTVQSCHNQTFHSPVSLESIGTNAEPDAAVFVVLVQ